MGIFGLFNDAKHLMALKNAINAQLLFEICSNDEKIAIKQSAIALFRTGGISHLYSSIKSEHQQSANEDIDRYEKEQDYHFYSMLSYAFRSLSYQPVLSGEEWQMIDNPYILQISEKDVRNAKNWFSDRHGINIQIKI